MRRDDSLTRRKFLLNSLGVGVSLGAGALIGSKLFADPARIAAKIENAPEAHPLIPALQLGTAALKAMENVDDYTATFTKRELIGRKLIDSQMEMKFRQSPMSVYLKFLKPVAGREALYVKGQNDDKMKAHDVGFAGLAGTLSLDVDGSFALAESRYPITMIGMQIMATKVLEQWLAETEMTGITVNYYPNARIGKVSCKAIESSHRTGDSGAKFAMTRLYVETESGLPIRVQQYDFAKNPAKQPDLVEDYMYSNIKTNVGLKDADFSVDNPAYRF